MGGPNLIKWVHLGYWLVIGGFWHIGGLCIYETLLSLVHLEYRCGLGPPYSAWVGQLGGVQFIFNGKNVISLHILG